MVQFKAFSAAFFDAAGETARITVPYCAFLTHAVIMYRHQGVTLLGRPYGGPVDRAVTRSINPVALVYQVSFCTIQAVFAAVG